MSVTRLKPVDAVVVGVGVAGSIVWAWLLTIPCSAFIAGVAWLVGSRYL